MSAAAALYIVVPVLNESPNLPRLFAAFHELQAQLGQQFGLQFIIVDDGSSDGTGALAKDLGASLPVVVLSHEVNEGPGRAFGTAFVYLAGCLKPGDWVATMEGDNTSRHELLKQMLVRAHEGFDVVLASPYLYGGEISNTSAIRLFTSHVANVFLKEALGIRGIMTMSSFYRLYRASILTRLQVCYGPRILDRRGFESMVEMLLKLIYLQAAISEVAMRLDTSRRIGKSKMNVLRTIVGYLVLWRYKHGWRQAVVAAEAAEPAL